MLYTSSSPTAGSLANVPVTLQWNNESAVNLNTGADGKTSVSRTDDDPTTLVMKATAPGAIRVNNMDYALDGVFNTTGCSAPGWLAQGSKSPFASPGQSGGQDACIPLRYTRVITNQAFSSGALAYMSNTLGTNVGLQGVPVTFSWMRGSTESQTVNTDTNGNAAASKTYPNDVATSLSFTYPSTYTQSGHRVFNAPVFASALSCTLPADWSLWNPKTPPTATSPGYLLGQSPCISLQYTEVPEAFSAGVVVFLHDNGGNVVKLAGVPVALTWIRSDGKNISTPLSTDANGYAVSNQSLRTSVSTSFQYIPPATININPQRMAVFLGFNFTSGAACSQPPDWSTWAKSSSQATSPAYTAGTAVCVQAEYQEIPQTFTLKLHAFYNDLTSGTPISLPGVNVTVNYLRGNGEVESPVNRTTAMIPVSTTKSRLPYTTTSFQVVCPKEFVSGGFAYVFKDFSAGAGGSSPTDWPWVNGPQGASIIATSPVYTYTTSRNLTAHYDRIPLPVIIIDPLSFTSYYWKARDIDALKPLPFVSGTINDAYNPGTPIGTRTNFVTITFTAPTGQTYLTYPVPVVATAVGSDGYVNGRLVLDEDAVRAIENAITGHSVSACTINPARLCFGTTVGNTPDFLAGATSEDQAIGQWTISATYTRIDPSGTPRIAPMASLNYTVIWHIQAQP